jgi:MFS family permease
MLRSVIGVSVGWLGISMIADGVPTLLLPHALLREQAGDATTVGVTTLIAIGLAALLQPVAGRWSDRVGRFPVIAAGSLAAVAGLALFGPARAASAATIVTLAGVSVAQAGHQALLPDRLPASWRGRGGGLKGAFDVGGAFLAFVVLAFVLGAGAPALAAALLAAILVGGFVAARLLLPARPVRRAVRPLLGAYRFDGVSRPLATLIAARFLFLLGIYAVGRFLLLFVADRLGLGADEAALEAGAALALLALATVVASPPSGWVSDRIGRRPVMLAGGVLAAAGIALLPAANETSTIIAFGMLMSLGSAAFGAGSWAMLTDLVAGDDAGRQLGLANIGTAGAAALAGAFGVLIDGAGYGLTFAVAALCSLAGGALAWRLTEAMHPTPAPTIGSAEGIRS